jgi:hypothetical protein
MSLSTHPARLSAAQIWLIDRRTALSGPCPIRRQPGRCRPARVTPAYDEGPWPARDVGVSVKGKGEGMRPSIRLGRLHGIPGGDVMLFVVVVAILLAMAMLALAGPLLEDILEWFRRVSHGRGRRVPPQQDQRVPRYSLHRWPSALPGVS